MGLLDRYQFNPQGFAPGGGLLDLIRQPQVTPSQGFAGAPSSFQSVGNYQMPVFGKAPEPDPAALPINAQPAQGMLPPQQPTQEVGFGDRLMAGLQGLSSIGERGLLPGIIESIGGFASGKVPANQTQQALIQRGFDPALAKQVASDPSLLRAVLPSLMGGGQTDDIKEYQEAVKQGFKGGLFDYKVALKRAGATNVNTHLNTGYEKEYDKAFGKQQAEEAIAIQKGGASAPGAIANLDLMERLTKDPNFYSGAGADVVTALKRVGVGLGLTPEDAAKPNEVFSKLSNQAVLDAAGGSLGAGFSNADRDFLQSANASLANTPEGNRAVIATARAVQKRRIEVANRAREYAKKNGGRIDQGFFGELSDWAEKNHLFGQNSPVSKASPGKTKSGVGWSIVQ